MEIAFGILGQTTMRMHGRLSTDWGSLKLQQLLAALLVQPKVRVGVNTLVDWVWSADEREPNDPAATFRTYAGRINKAMREAGVPATLHTIDGALHINVEREAIDYFAFESLVEQAQENRKEHDHEAACAVLATAFDLWRDRPLADLTSQVAETWRYWAVHQIWLPANHLLLGELIALERFETALQKLDELQREHRTDLGLARRRLYVLRELDRPDEMGAYHMKARKLLLGEEDPTAAEDLRKYYNALLSEPGSRRSATRTAPGARGAAERLATVPLPRQPADRTTLDRPPSLLPAFAPRGPSTLPPGAADFVGHHDLQKALDELASTADGRFRPGLVVLDGLAGIGKTALAVHWARRQYGKLVDTALYVDLHGFDGGRPAEAGDVIDELLDALDVPVASLASRARREAKLREILAGNRTLIVLDNAANSAHVLPLMLTLSPCLVVVTSRQGLTALASRHGARHCSVTSLNEVHAAQVLTSRIGSRADAEQESIGRLTALCGGLPLALQLVARHVESRRGAALTEFADELQDQSRLLDIGDDGDDPPANIRAALLVTYRALPSPAQTLFRATGLSPIPELTLHAAVALAGDSTKSVQRALDILVSTHFLTPTGTRDRYRLHDLLRAFARELAESAEHVSTREEAELRLLSFYLHTSYGADRRLFPFRPPVPMLPAAPHTPALEFTSEAEAKTWLLQERANISAIVPWAAQRGYHDFAWRIPHNLYGLYRRLGLNSELRTLYTISTTSTQAVKDLESEGATRSDLGLICAALGDWDAALREFHITSAIAQKTQSTMGMAISLSHLGTYEKQIGNLDTAAELYRRALHHAVAADSYGAQSAILHRLAGTTLARGRRDEALALYHQALRLREKIGNSHGQAESLIEIAAISADRKQYDNARHYGLQALAIIEKITDVEAGPRACYVMAGISYAQGDHQATIGYARQAARLAMRDHNAVIEANALHILGHALCEIGHRAAAEEGWLQAKLVYTDLNNRERVRHVQQDLAALKTTQAPSATFAHQVELPHQQ
ncbi:tetratricopeptide repeat protein [Amycolatopsis sp. NPDC058986]|uniref:AfsR/SARP family transcriptional regulator n=1 Tax=unclassified Amycolatopsis TaxID=2618356 RepID=UPI0036732465